MKVNDDDNVAMEYLEKALRNIVAKREDTF